MPKTTLAVGVFWSTGISINLRDALSRYMANSRPAPQAGAIAGARPAFASIMREGTRFINLARSRKDGKTEHSR